jgi:hypothetical protein
VAIAGPRNGTTTHTVDPNSGSASAGALFSPTAGNLLVCIVEGAVTSTTPTGWTLPTGGSAVNNTGLYVFWKTAAGADNLVTTHNGSNYPVVFDFYEFASGSTFGTSTASTGVAAAGGAGPTLSGLTGTNLICAVAAQDPNPGTSSVVWSAGTKAIDITLATSGTDGYTLSMAYMEDSALASWSSAATFTGSTTNIERLVFALKPVAGGAPAIPPILTMQTRRAY